MRRAAGSPSGWALYAGPMIDAPTAQSGPDETTATGSRGGGPVPADGQPQAGRVVTSLPWWLFVLTGVLWLAIGIYVLALRPGSAALVLAMITVALVVVGVLELVQAAAVNQRRWLHLLFGLVMLGAAGFSLYAPRATILVAAWVLAWYLLASGIVHIIEAFSSRKTFSSWWILLVLGVLESVIGVWAIVEPERTLLLLLVWAGVAALSRGIGDFMTAYAIREQAVLDVPGDTGSTS